MKSASIAFPAKVFTLSPELESEQELPDRFPVGGIKGVNYSNLYHVYFEPDGSKHPPPKNFLKVKEL